MKKNAQSPNSKKSNPKPVVRMIFDYLFDTYGPQGWWPLTELHEAGGANPTKTGSIRGYHPGDYTYPRTRDQQFEIICGALLTQNTSWTQVEKALFNLKNLNALYPEGVLFLDPEVLKEAIKPAGYFNQKAVRLKALVLWFSGLKGSIPLREDLLSLKGIGPETADSILLYAFKQPSFVVDSYTRRIVTNLGLVDERAEYSEIKALFEESMPEDFEVYQEFHALLVEHAKRYYQKKGNFAKCPLLDILQDFRF